MPPCAIEFGSRFSAEARSAASRIGAGAAQAGRELRAAASAQRSRHPAFETRLLRVPTGAGRANGISPAGWLAQDGAPRRSRRRAAIFENSLSRQLERWVPPLRDYVLSVLRTARLDRGTGFPARGFGAPEAAVRAEFGEPNRFPSGKPSLAGEPAPRLVGGARASPLPAKPENRRPWLSATSSCHGTLSDNACRPNRR